MPGRFAKLGSTMFAAALMPMQPSLAEEWKVYADPQKEFTVELPLETFRIDEYAAGKLTLFERDGDGVIGIFVRSNLEHLLPSAFAKLASDADQIEDVTYRAGGSSWFVLSGHYKAAADASQLIYYAKFVFSSNLERVAGFEISYSAGEKERMDAIVNHIEDTFRLLSR